MVSTDSTTLTTSLCFPSGVSPEEWSLGKCFKTQESIFGCPIRARSTVFQRAVQSTTAKRGLLPQLAAHIASRPADDRRPGQLKHGSARRFTVRPAHRARRPRFRVHHRDHACRWVEDGAHGRPLQRRGHRRAGRRRQVPVGRQAIRAAKRSKAAHGRASRPAGPQVRGRVAAPTARNQHMVSVNRRPGGLYQP